jgi:hypothetical protein
MINQCEGGWQPDLSKYVDREIRRKPPELDNEDDPLENHTHAPNSTGIFWRIITVFFKIIGLILTVVFGFFLIIFVSLLGGKSRRRRRL